MIISEQILDCAGFLLSDSEYKSAEMQVVCNKDGDFFGKLKIDGKVIGVTQKTQLFKSALHDILVLCEKYYKENIDENK